MNTVSKFPPNSQAARDMAYHVHPQTNMRQHEANGPFIIDKAEGIYLYDDAGKRYLDAMSGLWCVSLGYSNQALKDAASTQLERIPYSHTFAHRANDPSIDLAARLIELAPVPMSKVLFQCSGSEANDTATKLIWYYWNAHGKHAKKKIITRKRGYHGTGIASASLTQLPNLHREFDLPLNGFLEVTCPHFYRDGLPGESEDQFVQRLADELEALILREDPATVGGFFAEAVMGTGGVVVPPKGYFEAIQKVLRKYDILCVSDEVICGFGRTGEYWGCTAVGFEPDMITCAKALSSAYQPISAVLISEHIVEAMRDQSDKVGVFGHGYTYGGHPVAAAVALATLAEYDRLDIVKKVRDTGAYFQERLQSFSDHELVGEVRGLGLMGGVELVKDKASRTPFDPSVGIAVTCAREAHDLGLITRNLGDTMSFSPPLIITRDEIDIIIDVFGQALDATAAWAHREGVL